MVEPLSPKARADVPPGHDRHSRASGEDLVTARFVVPAERREAREPGPKPAPAEAGVPLPDPFHDAGMLGSRLARLRAPSGMTVEMPVKSLRRNPHRLLEGAAHLRRLPVVVAKFGEPRFKQRMVLE